MIDTDAALASPVASASGAGPSHDRIHIATIRLSIVSFIVQKAEQVMVTVWPAHCNTVDFIP
jgi:hypothetical protein